MCQNLVGLEEGSFLLDGTISIEFFSSILCFIEVIGMITYKPLVSTPEHMKILFLLIITSFAKLTIEHLFTNFETEIKLRLEFRAYSTSGKTNVLLFWNSKKIGRAHV